MDMVATNVRSLLIVPLLFLIRLPKTLVMANTSLFTKLMAAMSTRRPLSTTVPPIEYTPSPPRSFLVALFYLKNPRALWTGKRVTACNVPFI
jgi:hypothetical protein